MISQFGLVIGAMLLSMAIIVAWLFRISSAPTWARISAAAVLVALACYGPLAANSISGLPIITSIDGMPTCFELVGILARDDVGKVDLWSIYKNGIPRSYEIDLTQDLKKSLHTIANSLSQNGSVHVCRGDGSADMNHMDNPYGVTNESSANGGIFIDPSFLLNTDKVPQ